MKPSVIILIALCCASALALPNNRIIGGANASNGQFPHQISLRQKGKHSCGGSILDAKTILTAAHCVSGTISADLSVTLGDTKLSDQTMAFEVKSYTIHDEYNPIKVIHDIAIIKLREPIPLGDGIQAVALPTADTSDGVSVTLSGWGYIAYPGVTQPNDLQFIHLKTITNELCEEMHHNKRSPIVDTEICTFTVKGEGACQGDSGGPLIDDNGVQVGVVSWGKPCGIGYPDVFTRVYSYLDWIKIHRH